MNYSKLIEFFSTRVVTQKLITNTLSEGQSFLYFYIIMMFDWLQFTIGYLQFGERSSQSGSILELMDYLSIWSAFLVTAAGLVVCFVWNGGSSGRGFLTKFFAYSVTIGYKYWLLSLIAGVWQWQSHSNTFKV